jgi:hydrogenase expression/formation protein HypC
MCFATPGKVIKIKGKLATIQMPSHKHEADISLVGGVRIGDFLLVHNKMAINKIPATEALKILKLNKIGDHKHHDD